MRSTGQKSSQRRSKRGLKSQPDSASAAKCAPSRRISASESPRIAGVIYNRLFHWDYPALLNIDAAIIYAQDGVSDHIDTSLDSPYNTYLHVGLTPTPIANPGLASLQAALNPESHNYYYYVLNPATGAHQFSTTQEEHEQYRAQFAAAAAAASTQSEGE